MTNIATLGSWLIHVMKKADGALSLEESLHVIMDSIQEYFPCQSVAVILIDDDTKSVLIKISRAISYTFAKKFLSGNPSPVAEAVVLEQQAAVFNHIDPKSEIYQQIKLEHDFTSAVLVPIARNQRGVGYVFADRATPEKFTDADVLHLQVIAHLIGSQMEKFDLIRHARSASSVDDACGALQYKAFIPAFATERERALAHHYGLTLAIFSVGAFRNMVATFGIDAAHKLLADVVCVIRETCSDMDILARFSADELILCLSGLTKDEACKKLKAIQANITRQVHRPDAAPLLLPIGALWMESHADLKCSIQDVLSALGRNTIHAKTKNSGEISMGSL
jgi:GGDEF domain-containing protein